MGVMWLEIAVIIILLVQTNLCYAPNLNTAYDESRYHSFELINV
jgi:hypothetical protein